MLKIIAAFEVFFTVIKVFFTGLIILLLSLIGDMDYTGGQYGTHGFSDNDQWWWVETYDECQNAIDQLESRGSTFDESVIFSYDGEAFDVKYCFALDYKNYLRYGRDNPFKRKNEDVNIYAYIFFNDTSIDDFVYSYVHKYCAYYLYLNPEYIENNKYQNINAEDLEMTFNPSRMNPHDGDYMRMAFEYTDKNTGEEVFALFGAYEENMIQLSDEDIDAILDSIVVIGGNK